MGDLIQGRPVMRRGRKLIMADRYLDGGRVWDAASEDERAACEARHDAAMAALREAYRVAALSDGKQK